MQRKIEIAEEEAKKPEPSNFPNIPNPSTTPTDEIPATEEIIHSIPTIGPPKYYPDATKSPLPPEITAQLNRQWQSMYLDIDKQYVGSTRSEYAINSNRVRKIMKLEESLRLMQKEVPIMMAKLVELFITDLSLRSLAHSKRQRRKLIFDRDVVMATRSTDLFDFLLDIVPQVESLPSIEEAMMRIEKGEEETSSESDREEEVEVVEERRRSPRRTGFSPPVTPTKDGNVPPIDLDVSTPPMSRSPFDRFGGI